MEVRAFLEGRRPPAPEALRSWVGRLGLEGPAAGALVGGARAELGRTLLRPGRVRESAFSLLAADALLTWACEAALDEAHPEDALGRILRAAGTPEG